MPNPDPPLFSDASIRAAAAIAGTLGRRIRDAAFRRARGAGRPLVTEGDVLAVLRRVARDVAEREMADRLEASPRQPVAVEAAVELLRGLLTISPHDEAGCCRYCYAWIGVDPADDHKPDCPWQAAVAFLAGLPKGEG